jgi:hypothetical protein
MLGYQRLFRFLFVFALGFFEEEAADGRLQVRMRSMTVSREELFPRDLGLLV